MSKWQEFFSEPMSKQYTKRVLDAAQTEMAKVGVQKPSFFARSGVRWGFAAGFIVFAAALVINAQHDKRPQGEDFELLAPDSEMLKDADFFSELDTLEAWDELEASHSSGS